MTKENLLVYTPQLYFRNYSFQIQEALDTIDCDLIDDAYELLNESYVNISPVLLFGNGGSTAIANHFVSDMLKNVAHDVGYDYYPLQAHSLCANAPLLTCLSNDYGYEEVFASQIDYSPLSTTLCLGISSSGNSKNIVRAFETARDKGFKTLALVGFDGGAVLSRNLADVILHVKSNNYGIVEDCHNIILHSLIGKLRINNAIDVKEVRL